VRISDHDSATELTTGRTFELQLSFLKHWYKTHKPGSAD